VFTRLALPVLVLIDLTVGLPAGLSAASQASEPLESPVFSTVSVEPTNAKGVPLMRITLKPEQLTRTPSGYEASYAVTVFPFSFFNETGTIRIEVEPEILEKLGAGEVVSFTGQALNHKDQTRRVEGRAYPADAQTGKIKVIVFVGKVELIFNSTYRFTGEAQSSAAKAMASIPAAAQASITRTTH
jgi:hypothetical protein